jgi:hypothetical protein
VAEAPRLLSPPALRPASDEWYFKINDIGFHILFTNYYETFWRVKKRPSLALAEERIQQFLLFIIQLVFILLYCQKCKQYSRQ